MKIKNQEFPGDGNANLDFSDEEISTEVVPNVTVSSTAFIKVHPVNEKVSSSLRHRKFRPKNLVVSLDWEMTYFKTEKRLRRFLKTKNVRTLNDFINQYETISSECNDKKVTLHLENFHRIVMEIIQGPPFSQEILSCIKKNFRGLRKRPTLQQKAFLNALYFFESIFLYCKEFKNYVLQKSKELKLDKLPAFQ